MNDEFLYIDRTFDKTIFTDGRVSKREYDGCTFLNCDFSRSTFSECTFMDCNFISSNLSMAKLPGSGLKNATFEDCKLMGLRFDECEDFLFEVAFDRCQLDYSWFSRKKMPKTTFSGSSLRGVNFEQCDLSGADFDGCFMAEAVFNDTNLSAADFTGAREYSLNPEQNKLVKAKFAAAGLPGLLSKYNLKIVP